MTTGPGPEALPSPQRGTTAVRGNEVRPHRHPDVADSARPERASEYGLLALAERAGDPSAVEIQVSRDGHKATMGTGGQD